MGLTHWIAVMERSLLRLHESNAIRFEPLGPLVSYHGIRQPASGAIQAVLARIRREQLPIWQFLTDGGAWCGRHDRFAQAA
jgi:N-acyl amino acid synthase of PEP-CTERM/exosortase system